MENQETIQPKAEHRKLTKKQKGFIKDYVETGNGTKAVMNNYDVKKEVTAANIATENLRKPYIAERIESIAEQIPDSKLLQVHLEGLEATKKQGVGGMAIGISEGEIESMGHTDIFEPDYVTRHKYLDTAYKLKGSYAPEKNQNLNVNVDVKQNKETIRQIAQEVIKKLRDEKENQENKT